MRIATLPYKDRADEPEWQRRQVRKPETWWETVKLHFGPGEWNDHLLFGRIRIMPAGYEDDCADRRYKIEKDPAPAVEGGTTAAIDSASPPQPDSAPRDPESSP